MFSYYHQNYDSVRNSCIMPSQHSMASATLSIMSERQHQIQYIKTTAQDITYNIKHIYYRTRAVYLRLQASFIPVFSIIQSILLAPFLKKILINNVKGKSEL